MLAACRCLPVRSSVSKAARAMSMSSLNALVTGGARGIGRAFCESLLSEGAATVYIVDKNESEGRKCLQELEAQHGAGRCRFLDADVTDFNMLEQVFKTAASESGHIDVMVNNAGTLDEMNWEPVVHLNFMSVVKGCEIAMNHMNKKTGGRGGRIINTVSDLGLMCSFVLPVYSATKHAVRAYTSGMAMHPDQAETCVQFACICPGPVDTVHLRSMNNTNSRYVDMVQDAIEKAKTSPSRIGEGFTKLLRQKDINGAILLVDKEKCCFCKLDIVEL